MAMAQGGKDPEIYFLKRNIAYEQIVLKFFSFLLNLYKFASSSSIFFTRKFGY